MGRKLRELTIKDDFSVGVQGEIRLKPRNFGDFQRYPQSADVLSTLPSSALKITESSAVEVGEHGSLRSLVR